MANRTSPIRRSRRSPADIAKLRETIAAVVEEVQPATVRQVFYQLVSRGAIAKTEGEYKGTVCRLLADMRRSGEIPYGSIADNSRWMRKPDTYDSLESMLHYSQQTYRRAIWEDQAAYVEIWLEKEALAGVLVDVTDKCDVPLMVTKGYPSLSYLHSAGETIRHTDKPTHLYYFGDRDPSGVDIPRHVEKELRQFAPDVDITFECVAVTEEQIGQLGLPTRPTKKTDSRSKSFTGESVEVDAIPPADLRQLAADCIERHLDRALYNATLLAEAAERETLTVITEQLGGAA